MHRRVLITGAQGFLGRYLVAHWARAWPGDSILGVGRSLRDDGTFTHSLEWAGATVKAPLTAALRDLPASYRYAAVDLADPEGVGAVVGEFEPDVVIHSAASLRGERPDRLFQTNVLGTINLLEAVGRRTAAGRRRVVHVSSGAVYGAPGEGELPLKEDGRRAPVEYYGVSKLAAEEAARVAAGKGSIDLVVARVFNPVGPGADERHLVARLAGQIAAIEAGEANVLSVGRLDTTRDFVDVRDAAAAIEWLARRGEAGGVYNVASGVETECQAVLDLLLEMSGASVRVERMAGRAGDVPRHFADVGRLRKLGFEPAFGLRESVGEVLRYYREEVARAVKAGKAMAAGE